MATRNLLHRITNPCNPKLSATGGHSVFFLVFFLITLAPVWAQTVSYDTEIHFVQHLAWIGDEYAMRYEVIIEREEEGEYSRVLREFTDASFIEVSLPHGKYRYQVIPYDYLDQPVPTNEWMNFEVHPANEKLLAEETRDQHDNPEEEPSELVETEENTENQNQRGYVYAGAAWMPFLPISGKNLTPYGAGIRFGLVSAQKIFLNPGIELVSSWRAYEMVHTFVFDVNILTQIRFPGGRTALNFRLGMGGGFSFLTGLGTVSSIDQSAHANFGVSFLWLFLKNFYTEAGIDYSQFFSKDGFFRPWIGLGLQF